MCVVSVAELNALELHFLQMFKHEVGIKPDVFLKCGREISAPALHFGSSCTPGCRATDVHSLCLRLIANQTSP